MSNGQVYPVDAVGVLAPKMKEIESLSAGEVGFIIATIKVVADTKIGDTITDASRPTASAFPDFQEIKPMVFAGLYPIEPCLLYTSDAADERSSVDLGGRRIIK